MATKFFDEPRFGNVSDFIGSSQGQCFYIPAYQRDLSWSKENIERFFQDIVTGMQQLPDGDKDAVSFIGTMVYFHDITYKTINPIVRYDVPSKVLNVIDGQQRIATLMLTASVLHDYIHVNRRRISTEWLKEQAITMEAELESVFIQKYPTGDIPYYPRMIRAFEDQWSKKQDQKQYNSPLSHYLCDYYAFRESDNAMKNYKMNDPDGLNERRRKIFNQFNDLLRNIKKQVNRAVTHDAESGDIIFNIKSVAADKKFLSAIFNIDELPEGTPNFEDKKEVMMFKILALSSYILKRIHFIFIIVRENENYAYDIFEALNTTGQTLTAFETFKPVVIREIGLDNYENSSSKQHMDKVDELLKVLNKENEKLKTTSELIIHFALAENGKKITRAMRHQRQYLRDRYNDITSATGQEHYTRHFMHAAELAEEVWKCAGNLLVNPNFAFAERDDECRDNMIEADFCLQFLRDAKHEIVKSLLIRFYEAIKISKEPDKKQRIIDFCNVVKAVAAFFALWKSSRETTDGIDACHRTIMKELNRKAMESPLIDFVYNELRHFMQEGGNSRKRIDSLSDWAEKIQIVPIYRTSRQVAKFVLMVASHNTVPNHDPGTLKEALSGVVPPSIGADQWENDIHITIEHILPQSRGDNDALHRLGNLTLLPKDINSILSARPWEEKRKIYDLLSVPTIEERKSLLGTSDYDSLNRDAQKILLETENVLPMLQSLSRIDDFNEDIMKKREENISELAWEILGKRWLKITS